MYIFAIFPEFFKKKIALPLLDAIPYKIYRKKEEKNETTEKFSQEK